MLSNPVSPDSDDFVLKLKPTSACCAAIGRAVAIDAKPELHEFIDHSAGSRRQRLWELSSGAHCPVIGVCMTMDALRRISTKLLVGVAALDDYQLHCEAIAHSKRRSPMAEALQHALTQRFAQALRTSGALKSTQALASWWQQHSSSAQAGADLPGALWATLTHPRCDSTLTDKVLGEVHMIQHQVGVAQRTDQVQLERSTDQISALKRELEALQQRAQRQASEHAKATAQHQKEMMRLRCDVVSRDTQLAALADELQALNANTPQLKSRVELTRENHRQKNRLVDLEHSLSLAKDQLLVQAKAAEAALAALELKHAHSLAHSLAHALREAQSSPTDNNVTDMPENTDAAGTFTATSTATATATATAAASALIDRAVLCVGGRPASVPLYRHIVEKTGGRFLHHDGGEQESQTRLDATLAAADLVICQTGCISHGAYWRVKDHCKRHGKPCVFVENPGSASLRRALAAFQPAVLG